jgi:DNA excision repair protein ERCC-4
MTVTESDAEQILGAVSKGRRAAKVLPVILRDTREQLPLDRLFSPAVRVEVTTIGTGDYTLKGYSSQLAVERKSLPDLVHCSGHDRDRFFDQCRRMSDYRVRMLVIEADEAEVVAGAYRSNIDFKSVIGAVRAVQMDYGVAAYWVHDQRGAAKLIEWVCQRMVRKSGIYRCEEPEQ